MYQMQKKSISCDKSIYLGNHLNLDTFLNFEDILRKFAGLGLGRINLNFIQGFGSQEN